MCSCFIGPYFRTYVEPVTLNPPSSFPSPLDSSLLSFLPNQKKKKPISSILLSCCRRPPPPPHLSSSPHISSLPPSPPTPHLVIACLFSFVIVASFCNSLLHSTYSDPSHLCSLPLSLSSSMSQTPPPLPQINVTF